MQQWHDVELRCVISILRSTTSCLFILVFKLVYVCFHWSVQGGDSLSVQRQQLEELYLAHSGSMSILLEEDDGVQNHDLGLPQGPANFTLLWWAFLFTERGHVTMNPKFYCMSVCVMQKLNQPYVTFSPSSRDPRCQKRSMLPRHTDSSFSETTRDM